MIEPRAGRLSRLVKIDKQLGILTEMLGGQEAAHQAFANMIDQIQSAKAAGCEIRNQEIWMAGIRSAAQYLGDYLQPKIDAKLATKKGAKKSKKVQLFLL